MQTIETNPPEETRNVHGTGDLNVSAWLQRWLHGKIAQKCFEMLLCMFCNRPNTATFERLSLQKATVDFLVSTF